jgi:site-specific DNA recombinase
VSLRAVIYARVSSSVQRDRDTIASQLRVLPEYVERQGWQLVQPARTYVDDGHTAKAGHLEARTGLARLLRDAAAGLFDVVAVVDIDRLTRSEDLTERGAILGALQRAGVRVASATSGQVLDLATSTGDLFGSLHAFFAAEENRKRRERTTQGKLTAAARNRKPSGPTPYGLAYDRATYTWSIDPVRGPVMHEIVTRVAGGESARAIAEDLNARGPSSAPPPRAGGFWERNRIYKLVKSRHLIGEWTANRARGLIVKVPAIVTEELWQAAIEQMVENRTRPLAQHTKHVYLLERIARCSQCGSAMGIRTLYHRPGNRPPRYVCMRRRERPFDGIRCDAPILRVDEVDARVWEAIRRELADPALPSYLLNERSHQTADSADWQRDAAGYRKHLARLEKAETAIVARFRRGLISEKVMDGELGALVRERDAVRHQLATAEGAAKSATGAAARLADAEGIVDELRVLAETATPAERLALVRMLVEPGSVVVHGTDVRLTLRVRRPAGVSVMPSGQRTQHVDALRIQLVA